MSAALVAEGLHTYYGKSHILHGVGLEVAEGKITVVPEVTYLLATRLGPDAERMFVASLAAGEIGLEQVTRSDVERCRVLLDEYPHIGFVDASLVAVTERLRVRVVATTDRRHFGAVRPRHIAALELVP